MVFSQVKDPRSEGLLDPSSEVFCVFTLWLTQIRTFGLHGIIGLRVCMWSATSAGVEAGVVHRGIVYGLR